MMHHPWGFFAVAMSGRMLQGLADALVCITIPAIIAIEFPKDNEVYQAYLEMAMGIGLTLGPVMCSAVYDKLGFTNTFLYFAAFTVIFGFSSVAFIPSSVDKLRKDEPEAPVRQTADLLSTIPGAAQENVPYSVFFKNKRSLTIMVVNFSVQIFMVFFGPILVPQLIKLGLSQANAGYGCAICWLSYAIGCPIFA